MDLIGGDGASPYQAVIAEDDPDIRMLLGSALSSWGYDVLAVANGTDGLAAIRESRPDIALLDINMPGLTGPQIVRQIRRDGSTQGIPVMLITAEAEGQTAATSLADGADDYVRKPFHLAELRERVTGLTRRSRHLNELTSLREAVALPESVHDVGPVRAIVHNRAAPGALSGGDFLAVTAAPGGRVVAFAGDVEGHGIDAVALAAFTRAVLATNAAFTHRPNLLLRLANWTLAQRAPADGYLPLVTATCVVIDPATRQLHWSSAGHAPPLLSSCEPLTSERIGQPLGLKPTSRYQLHTHDLQPGERAMLCTDSLMSTALSSESDTDALHTRLTASADLPLVQLLNRLVGPVTAVEDDRSLLLLALEL